MASHCQERHWDKRGRLWFWTRFREDFQENIISQTYKRGKNPCMKRKLGHFLINILISNRMWEESMREILQPLKYIRRRLQYQVERKIEKKSVFSFSEVAIGNINSKRRNDRANDWSCKIKLFPRKHWWHHRFLPDVYERVRDIFERVKNNFERESRIFCAIHWSFNGILL